MDFGKVQQQRRQQETRRQIVSAVTTVSVVILLLTFVPRVQLKQLEKKTSASADGFLQQVKAEQFSTAWSTWFKSSLKLQHDLPAFEKAIRHVTDRKGSFVSWTLHSFSSRPEGKPYEFLSYDVNFARGVGTIEIALESAPAGFRIRAYRIKALGL